MYIDDQVVINVTQHVFSLSFIIVSLYPVMYIVDKMIGFVTHAFGNIRLDKKLDLDEFKYKELR